MEALRRHQDSSIKSKKPQRNEPVMSDLESKINGLLSDPEALSSIINVVKGLGGASIPSQNGIAAAAKPQAFTDQTEKLETGSVPALSNNVYNDKDGIISSKSIGLLLALRPFLSEGKREKIDVITKLLKIASLTELLK